MDIYYAEKLIARHNSGEIHIQKILANQKAIFDDIQADEQLIYDTKTQGVTYINKDGVYNTIESVSLIDQIIYKELKKDSSDDSGSSSGDCNGDCDNCDCNDDSSSDSDANSQFPTGTILKQGYVSNDIIYPTEMDNGDLIYDCALGFIEKYVINDNNSDGNIINDNNVYSHYFGDGYAHLTYGKLTMNIFIPETGYYSVDVRAGSEVASAKRGSIFLNNVERYVKTNANSAKIWNIVKPQKYFDSTDMYVDVNETKFLYGSNRVQLCVDPEDGTINNDYDCIILHKVPSQEDEEGLFHITREQYNNIIEQLTILNRFMLNTKEELKKTNIVVPTYADLEEYKTSDKSVDARIIVVVEDETRDNHSVMYSYNANTNEFVFEKIM